MTSPIFSATPSQLDSLRTLVRRTWPGPITPDVYTLPALTDTSCESLPTAATLTTPTGTRRLFAGRGPFGVCTPALYTLPSLATTTDLPLPVLATWARFGWMPPAAQVYQPGPDPMTPVYRLPDPRYWSHLRYLISHDPALVLASLYDTPTERTPS